MKISILHQSNLTLWTQAYLLNFYNSIWTKSRTERIRFWSKEKHRLRAFSWIIKKISAKTNFHWEQLKHRKKLSQLNGTKRFNLLRKIAFTKQTSSVKLLLKNSPLRNIKEHCHGWVAQKLMLYEQKVLTLKDILKLLKFLMRLSSFPV